jgi:heme-binding protein
MALRPRKRRWPRWLAYALVAALVLFGLAQLVPYGRDHANPRAGAEPRWDSPLTRALAADACFDCHSDLTKWPWYSKVAPVSWLIQRDVESGREELNFTQWLRAQDGAGDAVEVTRSGSMPPWYYKAMHPNARLTSAERTRLADGLERTLRASPSGG